MRQMLFAAAVVGVLALPGVARAQGFTPQELDQMSKERLDNGDFRRFAEPPAPSTITKPVPLHPAKGFWVCMSTDPYLPILAEPRAGSPAIGDSSGRIAAGADYAGYTSVLFREGTIGWVPKVAVRPYRNKFNPQATCTVGGIRSNGAVTFAVR